MKREDDEKLWDLLGHSAQPEISPFFARNVLREVRSRSERATSLRSWFSLRRLIPVSGLAVAIAVAIVVTHTSSVPREPAANEFDPVAKIDPQDYEVVADLDELLASEENNLWDENSSL